MRDFFRISVQPNLRAAEGRKSCDFLSGSGVSGVISVRPLEVRSVSNCRLYTDSNCWGVKTVSGGPTATAFPSRSMSTLSAYIAARFRSWIAAITDFPDLAIDRHRSSI